MNDLAHPITYRDMYEAAFGSPLSNEFFKDSNIHPDAPVKCNCKWDAGHESTCDIVAANRLLNQRSTSANMSLIGKNKSLRISESRLSRYD